MPSQNSVMVDGNRGILRDKVGSITLENFSIVDYSEMLRDMGRLTDSVAFGADRRSLKVVSLGLISWLGLFFSAHICHQHMQQDYLTSNGKGKTVVQISEKFRLSGCKGVPNHYSWGPCCKFPSNRLKNFPAELIKNKLLDLA